MELSRCRSFSTLVLFVFLLALIQTAAFAVPLEEKNIETVIKLVNESWNNGNIELLDEYISADYSEDGNEVHGPDLFKNFIQFNRMRRPDFKISIKDIFAEKEKVMVHYAFEGYDIVSHAPINFDGIYILNFKRGKIASGQNIYDNRYVLEQMDHAILPPSSSAAMNRATFLDSLATKLLHANEKEYATILFKKAIELDPTFYYPYARLATIQILLGHTREARSTLHQCYDKVETLQEKRYTCYLIAASYFEDGDMQEALIEMDRALVHAEHSNSVEQVISWYNTMSMVWRELGDLDKADTLQDERLDIVQRSNLPIDVKENFRGDVLWNRVNNALLRDDLAAAKKAANEFMSLDIEEDPRATPNYKKIQGVLTLYEKHYNKAIEFYTSVYQSPFNFRRLALAYEGAGDMVQARRTWYNTANFNVPSLPWLLMRKEAQSKLAGWASEE